jgi:hypothetical protein
MHPLEGLKREALGGPGSDVDQKPRRAPSLVLVGINVERRAPDLTQENVSGRRRQLAVLKADRSAAVAAAPGLEERERPVGGLEATNHLKSRPRDRDSGPTILSRCRHL